jgi:ribosomal protein L40E
MQCATHPRVETELACGRCGKAICPRCLVQTPVGARCRECAGVRRLPTFEVSPASTARGLGASVATGAVAGAAWGGLLPYTLGVYGYFVFFIALGIGYAVGEAVSWATNRKRGPVLQGIAVAGVVEAYLIRNLLEGVAVIPANDLWGYILVAVAAIVAVGRLR